MKSLFPKNGWACGNCGAIYSNLSDEANRYDAEDCCFKDTANRYNAIHVSIKEMDDGRVGSSADGEEKISGTKPSNNSAKHSSPSQSKKCKRHKFGFNGADYQCMVCGESGDSL